MIDLTLTSTTPSTHEGSIPRPGFKMPWLFVAQAESHGFAWGLFSQGAVAPRFKGWEPTLEAAVAVAEAKA